MENSVLKYFEKTVSSFPNKTALVDQYREISFLEFKEQALKIAAQILQRTNVRNNPVLVFLPKDINMVISFMGILYSGNFYTPIDVRYPTKKILGIIEKLNPVLIISNDEFSSVLVKNGVEKSKIVNIESSESEIYDIDSEILVDKIISIDPVYTFFTSGSTGVPKGVTISNLNIMHHLDWFSRTFQIDCTTVMGNLAPFHFDISTHDVYSCIFNAATLVIIPEKFTSYPIKLVEFMNEKKVNTIHWVPSAYSLIAEAKIFEIMPLKTLKVALFSGEIMPAKVLNYWLSNAKTIKVAANLYGPTEATVDCSYYIVDRSFRDFDPIPIGKACNNVDLLLIDDNLKLITLKDQIGEIYIRGATVSCGYWCDSERTKESFVQNPLNSSYVEKVYKTGDLACYNEHGEIIFLGRKDSQIKHMGYRIELGEIENASYGLENIDKACCIYDLEKKEIVLFYMSDQELNEVDIKRGLIMVLPKYMIPQRYIYLRDFPLNSNGKVDRVKLKQIYNLK